VSKERAQSCAFCLVSGRLTCLLPHCYFLLLHAEDPFSPISVNETCCDRSGGHVRVAFDWALRLAKPRLYYEEGSLMADLLALCPVLYKDYAPPLVSMNGGMHMVLSVGEPLRCMRLI